MKKLLFPAAALFCSSLSFGQSTTASNSLSLNGGGNVAQYLGSSNSYPVLFSSNSVEHMRLTVPGLFGIGTAYPLEKLSLNGNILVTNINTQTSPASAALIKGNSAYSTPLTCDYTWFNNTSTGIFHPAASTMGFSTNGSEIMRMTSTGNVGIGTTNPTTRFTVNGKVLIGDPALVTVSSANYLLFVQTGILTEKVKVALRTTTDWSDYVFAKDYQLRPLSEVKTFIAANSHLPGVPSAQQLVEEQGYDLGKMDAKLLEKIEELTLYLLSQQSAIEKLEAETAGLKKQISDLTH